MALGINRYVASVVNAMSCIGLTEAIGSVVYITESLILNNWVLSIK